MKKHPTRLLNLLLLLVFSLTSLFAFVPRAEADVLGPHSSWAEKELNRASRLDLIPGRLYGTDLTDPISRAEASAVMVKMFESAKEIEIIDVPNKHPFVDTNDPEVVKAYNLGIINGVGNGRFDPYSGLTREQGAKMICNTHCALMNMDTIRYKYTIPKFEDDYLIADWAYGSVYFYAQSGIIAGVGHNYFAPKANFTREQAILLALRLYDSYPYLHQQDFVTSVEWR